PQNVARLKARRRSSPHGDRHGPISLVKFTNEPTLSPRLARSRGSPRHFLLASVGRPAEHAIPADVQLLSLVAGRSRSSVRAGGREGLGGKVWLRNLGK